MSKLEREQITIRLPTELKERLQQEDLKFYRIIRGTDKIVNKNIVEKGDYSPFSCSFFKDSSPNLISSTVASERV